MLPTTFYGNPKQPLINSLLENEILVGIYNQQFQGPILFNGRLDFQGIALCTILMVSHILGGECSPLHLGKISKLTIYFFKFNGIQSLAHLRLALFP